MTWKMRNKVLGVGRCELCGSTRNLEAHHIIPSVCSIEGVDLDSEDNLICLCCSCHGKLTPRNILVKYGMHKKNKEDWMREIFIEAATALGEFFDEEEKNAEEYGYCSDIITASDLIDFLNNVFIKNRKE